MVNTQTLRADASTLVQDVVGGSWLGIVSRLRDAADEIDRLRAKREALRALLQEWRDTPFFDTRDEWERWVGDYGARVDAALAAGPAPQADDRLKWAEAGAREMQDKADDAAYTERIRATNAQDRMYNRACLDCARKIRELDASIVAQEVIARRALDAAVPEPPQAESAHDKMLDALNEMAADCGREKKMQSCNCGMGNATEADLRTDDCAVNR